MIGAREPLGVAVATAVLAAPAFADSTSHSGIHQYIDCDQVQPVVGFRYNAGTSGDLADTLVEGTLPDTGGLSLSALAGCALVAAGSFSITRLISRRGGDRGGDLWVGSTRREA